MLKRLLLGLTFIAAFGVVGIGVTDTAEAWRRWRRPYVSYYNAPPRSYFYSGYVPYRSYYRSYYRPRYYRAYYDDYYYGYPDYYYYGPRARARVSVGF